MRAAPLMRAPWMAAVPMPPAPITTAVSPPRTLARRAAEPYPVGTAQASSAAGTSGKSRSILTNEFADDDGVFGERPDLGYMPQVSSVDGVMAKGAVGRHAGCQRPIPGVAQVFHARGAPPASPANRDEGCHHMIAGREAGHSRRRLRAPRRNLRARRSSATWPATRGISGFPAAGPACPAGCGRRSDTARWQPAGPAPHRPAADPARTLRRTTAGRTRRGWPRGFSSTSRPRPPRCHRP